MIYKYSIIIMHSWWQHCHPRNPVHALHALPTFHLGSYLARLPATLLPVLQAVLSGEIVETSGMLADSVTVDS